MFAAIVISLLLLVLLVPSWIVLFLHRVTVGKAAKAAWPIWITQILASVFSILLADRVGLLNPAGYSLGICVFVGLVGAFFLRSRIE